MKNILLFVVLFVLLQITSASSQTMMDYVSGQIGDTLVVKTQDEMNGDVNALYQVIKMDTLNVPAGRVYKLKAGGLYPLLNNPNGYANRTTVIVGSDPTALVVNKSVLNAPPLIVGSIRADGSANTGGLSASGNLVVKNCALAPTANDGSEGWLYAGTNASGSKYTFDNCLFEHTRWAEVGIFNANCSVFLQNCYFVNLTGQPCRRNGGIYDGFANADTFLVENCTHINTQGSLYKWRNYTANRIIINHNTFVDCAGYTFMDLGTQTNASYTNNMFVNVNIQPFSTGAVLDNGEIDLDQQAMGLVNVYPDSTLEANKTARKFLVEGNLTYWDPYFANVADTANALKIDGRTTWISQMVRMNPRTKAMFDNSSKYPYLVEGVWYGEKPVFTNPRDLFGAALVNLKKFAIATMDTGGTAVLPDWRVVGGAGNYIYNDWPIPVDLSYSNAKLLTGATGGFPVGDVNWFPTQKKAWLAQRAAEYTNITNAMAAGKTTITTGVKNVSASPNSFELGQNYPNPFNPSTQISYVLSATGFTTLKVYNVIGEEVANLVNGIETAGSHEVKFDASRLSSGVYFYTLRAGNFVETKKMMLMK